MTVIAAQPASPRQARRDYPRSAFRNLTVTEARLLVREVVPLLWGAGFPMVLLSVIGTFSSGPDKSLGGGTLVAAYVPVLIAFSCATFALQGLPTVLANYRERGILRRLNATPVGAGRLLGAQLTVNLSVTVLATTGILVAGRAAFGVPLPGQPAGFALAFVLAAAAMLGLGLLVLPSRLAVVPLGMRGRHPLATSGAGSSRRSRSAGIVRRRGRRGGSPATRVART